jgi:hypothetical protein
MAFETFTELFPCFNCTEPKAIDYTNEKVALLFPLETRDAAQVADGVIDTIRSTNLSGLSLEMQLNRTVGINGWTENIAKWVLEKLCYLLEQEEEKLGPTVRDAYHKAWEVAKSIEGFVIEHPVFCTIVALGVLVSSSEGVYMQDEC